MGGHILGPDAIKIHGSYELRELTALNPHRLQAGEVEAHIVLADKHQCEREKPAFFWRVRLKAGYKA